MTIEKIIAENLNIDIESIKDDSHFVNDLGADSLNIVEVVMGIEQEFDIEIKDEDVEKLSFQLKDLEGEEAKNKFKEYYNIPADGETEEVGETQEEPEVIEDEPGK